jgi:hypothetical protein
LPKDKVLQGKFGTCYGCAALNLLQYHFNQSKNSENTGHPNFALLDVLGQGCCGQLKEGGASRDLLYKIKKSLKVAVEPYPLDYTTVFEKIRTHQGRQVSSCPRIIGEILPPELSEINEVLNKNSGNNLSVFEVMNRHPAIQRESIPPFNLHTYDSRDVEATKNQIKKILASRPSVPVLIDYCHSAIGQKCAGFHATTISGFRTVCCDGQCQDELQLEDSNGSEWSGWFLADPMIESSVTFNQGYTYITPCSSESDSKLQSCEEFVLSDFPMHFAVIANDLENIKKQAKKQVDINGWHSHGYTPLMMAIKLGHKEAITELLNLKADVNLQNKGGLTPLVTAVEVGDSNTVTTLLSKGTDIELQSRLGSPLSQAGLAGKNEILKQLLKMGAEPNKPIFGGNSPLHAAVAGAVELIKVLRRLNGSEKQNLAKLLKNTALKMANIEAKNDREVQETIKLLTFNLHGL